MKIRIGFVSNSSSASFTLPKSAISKKELYILKHHIDYARNTFKDMECMSWADDHDAWTLYETDDLIEGSTTMTNFDMEEFMRLVGIEGAQFTYD